MSGVVLRDYQDEAIDRVLKARDRGINKQLGVAATGLGKQAPLDEPVLTPTGWSVMGDLVPGSLVIGGDGCPVEVQSIHPQGIKPVVKVTFTDGSWTRCGPEHLWAARTKYDKYRDRPYRTMPTSALRPGWQIPLVAPVEFSTTDLPVDPYTLGVLLGDGSVGLPRLSVCTDRWIADHLGWTYLGDHSTSPYTVEGTIKDHDLVDGMKALGLWGKHSREKHIPTPYLTAPAQDRLALLRGLLDTDGYAMSSGGVEFCSTSENLVLSVAELVRSLGGVARNITSRITQYPHGGEKKNGRRSWRVNIKTSPGMNPFLLPRKADAWVPPTKYLPARVVRSVEADGPDVEQVCIKIANDDGLYVTRDYIVTHNTIVFCSLAMQLNVPTLILAHRDELISQAVEKLLLVWPEADVGVVKAERNEINHQVVVASVQSLRKPRLAKMARDMFDGGLIITDEAHHATATSYRNVYEHFGCGNPGGPLHLGVTATPDRGDGGGLNAIYEEITFTYDLLWGIQRGYLADLKGLRIQLKDVDFTQARISQGDYAAGDVGQMLENADAPDLIAAAWLEHASDRKTLIFTPTVATAEATAESFISMGVEAAVVSAKTPLDERRLMLKRFAAGELRVIANCGVLTEGFDDPAVNCIVVARPTKSRALYAQIVGRGSRKHPDKTDCLVMDVCGASDENSLLSVPSLFGIEPKDKEKFDASEETIGEFIFAMEKEKVRRGEMQAKAIDLFQKVIDSPINWVHFTARSGLKTYAINLGSKDAGSIVIDHLGGDDERQWHCYLRWDRGVTPTGDDIATFANGDSYRTLIREVDLEMAQGVGEDYVRKNGVSALTNKNAAWRDRPPTEKQLAAAAKWKIVVGDGWTAGQLSSAIDEKAQASKHRSKDQAPRKPPPSWVNKNR